MGDSLEENWTVEDESRVKQKQEQKTKQPKQQQADNKKPAKKDKSVDQVNTDKTSSDKKRKIEGDGDEAQSVEAKDKKKRKTISEKLKESRKAENYLGDLKTCSSKTQAEFFWKCYMSENSNKTDIELDPIRINENHFYGPFSADHTLENFEKVVHYVLPSWKKKFKNKTIKGSPYILILSSSAVRANEVVKVLRNLALETKVAKLFAKHLKPEEQKIFLNSNYVGIGVGTPNRIFKLIEEGDLKVDHIAAIVLDMFVDQRDRTILEIGEVRKDLFKITDSQLNERIQQGKTKLLLF